MGISVAPRTNMTTHDYTQARSFVHYSFICLFILVTATVVVLVMQTLYAFRKEDGSDFKLDRIPAHSGWIHQFTLQVIQTRNSSTDVMYFVYPANTLQCAKSVTRDLSMAELYCFPRDFFYSNTVYQADYRKVWIFNRGEKMSYGIALDDYHKCCGKSAETEYFFANLSLPRE